ncbi:hypothetical protein NMG60_11020127 [Bertholletia excelsa]
MAIRIKTSLLVFLVLLICFSSAEGFNRKVNPIYLIHKDRVQVNSRRLLVFDAVLDYDYAGANPRHDPRKGRSGRNP